MKTQLHTLLLILFSGSLLVGCDADARATEDSTQLEVDVPTVDVGDAPVDLDPTTDDDVDTPLKGDS